MSNGQIIFVVCKRPRLASPCLASPRLRINPKHPERSLPSPWNYFWGLHVRCPLQVWLSGVSQEPPFQGSVWSLPEYFSSLRTCQECTKCSQNNRARAIAACTLRLPSGTRMRHAISVSELARHSCWICLVPASSVGPSRVYDWARSNPPPGECMV